MSEAPTDGGPKPLPPYQTTEAHLVHWFTYHSPNAEDVVSYQAIRKAALDFARVILAETPPCPDQTVALRKLRESVMMANMARALRGK